MTERDLLVLAAAILSRGRQEGAELIQEADRLVMAAERLIEERRRVTVKRLAAEFLEQEQQELIEDQAIARRLGEVVMQQGF